MIFFIQKKMSSFHLNKPNNNIIDEQSLKTIPQKKPTKDEILYKTYYLIPPKQGRYIVLDTETTGLNENSQIVELGCHEIINGKLTGGQFHIYIRPRTFMDNEVIKIHKITNTFYDDYYKGIYEGDKQNLINFIKFVGNSLIFAHNAPFDMNAINKELKFWKLNEISFKRFRCTMRIFTEVIGKIDPLYYDKFVNLEKCCEFFKLKCEKDSYHNALFDSFMTARLIDKLYELIEGNQLLKKKIYIGQKSIYNYLRGKNNNYIKTKKESKNKNNEKFLDINRNNFELKQELTSSTGGENDESSLEKIKEERINKQLENGELSNEIIEQIFSDF